MYIVYVVVCLFSLLNCGVDALQISSSSTRRRRRSSSRAAVVVVVVVVLVIVVVVKPGHKSCLQYLLKVD